MAFVILFQTKIAVGSAAAAKFFSVIIWDFTSDIRALIITF
jgi:hypothetical protein